MEKKIRSELMKMSLVMLVLIGLGIYAHEFVIAGIQAKMALNLSIFATFGLAAWLAFRNVLELNNEVLALNALKVDYGTRAKRPLDPYRQPAKVFHEPQLLGQGYRMITEELGKQDSLHLSNATVQTLLHDVDQRINDRKSTIMYFSGLMVFLGLLGAFMGLMKTVHSVGDLIGSMDVSGAGGSDSFGKLIEGMKGPLNGMSVGFSSSLFGLMTSMVLGALERFMTSALKTLRNEFEHWMSNIAELEASSEQGAGAKAEIAGIASALATGSRQLEQVQAILRTGADAGTETNRAIAAMATEIGTLAGHVGQIADPRPVLAPVAESVAELARNQSAIVARMEAMFRMAEQDRAAMRVMLDAIDTRAHRHPPVDAAALHGQLERLVALQAELAERDPVIVAMPPPARGDGWRTTLRNWWRPAGNGAVGDRAIRALLRTLGARQEQLSHEMRAALDDSAEWMAAQRESDRAVLRELVEDRVTADLRIAGEDGTLHGARAGMEMLARRFDSEPQDGPPADAVVPPAPRRAARGE